jgi:hypothetical protein
MRALLADLTWQPGRGVEIPARRAAWNRVRTSVEVFALNAARLGAAALLAEVGVGLVKRRPSEVER